VAARLRALGCTETRQPPFDLESAQPASRSQAMPASGCSVLRVIWLDLRAQLKGDAAAVRSTSGC